MKYGKLLVTLLGGWILFIGLDTTNGHMGALGAKSLKKPLQLAWTATRILRTLTLFIMAACTLLLVARQDKHGKKQDSDNV